jgi:hypothetical protein
MLHHYKIKTLTIMTGSRLHVIEMIMMRKKIVPPLENRIRIERREGLSAHPES